MDIAVVVDASVWVSWLRPQDINHQASLLWMEKFIDEEGFLVAPSLLLIEVAAAISRPTGQADLSREAVRKLHNLDTIFFVPLDNTLVETSIDIAADLQLRAGGCILCGRSTSYEHPVGQLG
jgi:predicted nucleic acid-binding protein